jgi:death-on-curing protein
MFNFGWRKLDKHGESCLTVQNIIDIHNDIIEIYGGTKGLLNKGTIEYLVYLLNEKSDVFKKATLVLEHIIINHPFVDGNKRTAFEVTDILLRGEGYHIHADEEEIQNALLKIAKYECTSKQIEEWLRKIIRPLHLG